MKALPPYREALEDSGHQTPSQPTNPPTRKKQQRRRNIIWFNPPYNQNVKTNVARIFLELIDTHFHKRHKYHKLFNRKNVKVSNSCMKNMGTIIAAHNAKILTPQPVITRPTKLCNCTKSATCPLDGKCLSESIIYKASVSAPGTTTMVYSGLTANTFKKRYADHKISFDHERYRSKTALSIYLWELKDRGLPVSVKWEIAHQATPYQCGSRKCDLCIYEKTAIALANPESLLNKRSEIISGCRHRGKFTCKAVMEDLLFPNHR